MISPTLNDTTSAWTGAAQHDELPVDDSLACGECSGCDGEDPPPPRSPGTVRPYYLEVPMHEISLFVDESGENDAESKYHLFTLVLHEQDFDIDK